MESIHAVPDPVPDPKKGKTRAQSGVSFPYFDLDSCIEVAERIHHRAGGVCDLPQLAVLLGYSGVSNGAFRSRISATKRFGLIEEVPEDKEKLRVTRRGMSIVAEVSEQEAMNARVAAFLEVELFRKVYEQFNGTNLPSEVGLRNLLHGEYKVVKERVNPTVRILLDSAEQAGFFAVAGNRSRMVKPLGTSGASEATVAASANESPSPSYEVGGAARGNGGGGGGNGTGGDSPSIDPALRGLLEKLPPGGSVLSARRRGALIDAFKAYIDFIYPEQDGEE